MKLSWRNLWRNKRRTLITVASVAVGIWLVATFVGMAQWSYGSMIDSSSRMGFGHSTIQPKGYQLAPSLEKKLSGAVKIREDVLKIEGVDRSVVRITGQAMFATASRTIGGAFLAIDPAQENESVNIFMKSMIEGEPLERTDGRGIVIGKAMAERLDLRLGKKLVYTAIDANGEMVSSIARIRGIFETGVDGVDSATVLLPIDTVRHLLGYGPDEATMVSVYLDNHRETDRITGQIVAVAQDDAREIMPWHETQPEIASMIAMDASTNLVFNILLGLLVAAGVLNTMLMSVLERKRELGIMLALGFQPRELSSMVVIESIYIGIIGTFVGAILFAPWLWFMDKTGIDLSETYGDMDSAGVVFDPVLRLVMYPDIAAMIVAIVLVLTVVAGFYPAFRAGRCVPIDALRAH